MQPLRLCWGRVLRVLDEVQAIAAQLYVEMLEAGYTAVGEFHYLHHRYFEVNYGNTQAPIDKVTGTWHDGTREAHERLKGRRRADQVA